MWGGVQAGLCYLRYFTDDRGRNFVERGLERVHGGVVQQQLARFLAIFAACSMFFFVCYSVPVQWFALHAESWPVDIQKRSYFMGASAATRRVGCVLIRLYRCLATSPASSILMASLFFSRV